MGGLFGKYDNGLNINFEQLRTGPLFDDINLLFNTNFNGPTIESKANEELNNLEIALYNQFSDQFTRDFLNKDSSLELLNFSNDILNMINNFGKNSYSNEFTSLFHNTLYKNVESNYQQDYFRNFGISSRSSLDSNSLIIGNRVLNNSNNTMSLVINDLGPLAKNIVRHFTKAGEIDTETSPTVKDTNTNSAYSSLGTWGDTAVKTGLLMGLYVGGKWGNALADTATGVQTTINAVKNLKALKSLKKGTKGLKNAKTSNIAAIGGAVSDIGRNFLAEKTEYSGDRGNVTETLDNVYDGISDALMSIPGWGMLAGGIMKGGAFLGQGLNNLGGGTDGMTTTDAILGSSFLNLTPFGLINGFGGKTTDTITKDVDTLETVGASYGGSYAKIDDAVSKSGKKYGLFSLGAYDKANELINEATRQQSLLTTIADDARDRFNIKNSMSSINGNRLALQLQGGYNQSAIRAGKQGMVILLKSNLSEIDLIPEESKSIEISFVTSIPELELSSLIQEFDDGGVLEYIPTDPLKIISFVNKHKNVNFVLRMKDSYRDTIQDWEFENTVATHKMAVEKDRGKIKVFPMVLEIDGKLHDFTDPKYNHGEYDALESAEKNGDIIIFDNFDDALWFTKNYKEYYPSFNTDNKKTIEYNEEQDEYIFNFPPDHQRTLDELNWYNSEDPEAIEFRKNYEYNKELNKYTRRVNSFKEGGSFNVIPEGALHARLHHMENADNLTKKGIPVVSENENGLLEQHAEIELAEIILRLSLTKRLEELAKEGTDESAIEAGKILVEEILNNTIDNTNKLL